jgi:opacity protein-like surface antigen
MRTLFAAMLMAGASVIAAPALAADMPYYPPVIEIPDVDASVGGAFYLRGSVALNALWAPDTQHPALGTVIPIDRLGGGQSVGVGVGYEMGNGLRFDVTADNFQNDGMNATVTTGAPLANGPHTLNLRSTIVLANAYYDYYLSGYGPGSGNFVYGGAGVGLANNYYVHTTTPAGGNQDLVGNNLSAAAAVMVGFGVDYGDIVADIGYRGIYINSIQNNATTHPYKIDNAWAHELRGTVRYRFN